MPFSERGSTLNSCQSPLIYRLQTNVLIRRFVHLYFCISVDEVASVLYTPWSLKEYTFFRVCRIWKNLQLYISSIVSGISNSFKIVKITINFIESRKLSTMSNFHSFQCRISLHTAGNMGLMICLGQGGLHFLSAS